MSNRSKRNQKKVINKEIKVQKKLSFERMGDDLTELILQYLPLEEKIRLQCVSKQWRSLIFNKQFVIIAGKHDFNGITNLDTDYQKKSFGDRLRNVLKMCPNVRTIDLGNNAIKNRVLDIIIELCPRLQTIVFCSLFITHKAIKSFGEHFGPQLKCLHLKNSARDLAPNLTHLELNLSFAETFTLAEEIAFIPNLKVFKIKTWKMIDILFFESLPRLVPNVHELEVKGQFEPSDNILDLLTRMTKLKRLTFKQEDLISTITDEGICNFIDNCSSIKEMSFDCILDISNKTIDKLIGLANKRSNEMIIFKSHKFEDEANIIIHCENLPKNLNIQATNRTKSSWTSYSLYPGQELKVF